MIEYNDSNADCSKNGLSVFLDAVDTDEDVFISSSCMFMAGLRTTGRIKAQYNLSIIGSLSAGGDVDVGGTLNCTSLQANNVTIGRNLTVSEDIDCVELSVGTDAYIGGGYCHKAEIGGSITSFGMLDIQDEISAEKSIVCMDSIIVSGTIKANCVIANSLEASDELINHNISIPNGVLSERTKSNTPEQVASFKNVCIQDILQPDSALSIGLDDCALFLDTLNSHFCEAEFDDQEIEEYLAAYGGFFSGYLEVGRLVQMVRGTLGDCDAVQLSYRMKDDRNEWFKMFIACAEYVLSVPDWFVESRITEYVMDRLARLLEYQESHLISTDSERLWAKTVGYTQALKERLSDNASMVQHLKTLKSRMYLNIGLRKLGIKIKLPKD